MKKDEVKSILIIGMAGGLAKILTGLLSKEYPEAKIVGIDSRTTKNRLKNKNISYKKIKYTRSDFEKIFRSQKFDVIYHLARMSHGRMLSKTSLSQRLDLNLMGTQKILNLALENQVKKVIILSTYHVYGALNDNPTFIREDSPLKASIKYPDLRDVVEMDQLATNWMWKNQQTIQTIVLRPCSIIGPQINNTITQYLTSSYTPLPVDFNPMFQFIHEFDMARTLLKSISDLPTGVYNVAPDDVISLKTAKKTVGNKSIPVPIFLFEHIIRGLNVGPLALPDYLIDYIKFPCIIDNSLLKKHMTGNFRFTTPKALKYLTLS